MLIVNSSLCTSGLVILLDHTAFITLLWGEGERIAAGLTFCIGYCGQQVKALSSTTDPPVSVLLSQTVLLP